MCVIEIEREREREKVIEIERERERKKERMRENSLDVKSNVPKENVFLATLGPQQLPRRLLLQLRPLHHMTNE